MVGGVGCGDVRDSQEGVKAAMGQHPGGLGPCLLPTDQKVIQRFDGGWNETCEDWQDVSKSFGISPQEEERGQTNTGNCVVSQTAWS